MNIPNLKIPRPAYFAFTIARFLIILLGMQKILLDVSKYDTVRLGLILSIGILVVAGSLWEYLHVMTGKPVSE